MPVDFGHGALELGNRPAQHQTRYGGDGLERYQVKQAPAQAVADEWPVSFSSAPDSEQADEEGYVRRPEHPETHRRPDEKGKDAVVHRRGRGWHYRELAESKRAEDQLREAYGLLEKRVQERTEELREALRSRDEFLSIASHELKTPLTSLLLQLQLLGRHVSEIIAPTGKTSPDPEKLLHAVRIAERQSKKLAALVDELLDLTRIRAGKLSLSLEEIQLGSLVQETVERQKDAASRTGSEISVSVDPEAKGEWDRMRLEQVITNLLSNALKYGNGKPVSVTVGRDAQRKLAILRVADQGMGISQELKAKVFEPYERVMGKGRENISGLGLGLYITRQIVEAHGGTIDFESKLNDGSVFTVTLPLGKQA